MLPAHPTGKLVDASKEDNETQREKGHNEKDDHEQNEEKLRHVRVFPKDQVTRLLKEVCYDIHPLQRKVGSLLRFFVLAPHAYLSDVILQSSLLHDCLTIFGIQQWIHWFYVHNLKHSHYIICGHEVWVEEIGAEEELLKNGCNASFPKLRICSHNPH